MKKSMFAIASVALLAGCSGPESRDADAAEAKRVATEALEAKRIENLKISEFDKTSKVGDTVTAIILANPSYRHGLAYTVPFDSFALCAAFVNDKDTYGSYGVCIRKRDGAKLRLG